MVEHDCGESGDALFGGSRHEAFFELRTVFEQMADPYPDGVELKCESAFADTVKWREYKEENDGNALNFIQEMNKGLFPCDVSHWERGEYGTVLYTAVLLDANKESKAGMLQDVPRDAFVFVDKPYKSDMHLPNAFRHDITIPDEILLVIASTRCTAHRLRSQP